MISYSCYLMEPFFPMHFIWFLICDTWCSLINWNNSFSEFMSSFSDFLDYLHHEISDHLIIVCVLGLFPVVYSPEG